MDTSYINKNYLLLLQLIDLLWALFHLFLFVLAIFNNV